MASPARRSLARTCRRWMVLAAACLMTLGGAASWTWGQPGGEGTLPARPSSPGGPAADVPTAAEPGPRGEGRDDADRRVDGDRRGDADRRGERPEEAGGPGEPARRPLGGWGDLDRPRDLLPERLSEEDQRRFRVFMSSYMPHLLFASEDAARPPRQRLWLRGVALFHYRRLERVRRDFPELGERVLADVRDVDEAVRLAREYRTLSPEGQEQAREEITRRLLSVGRGLIEERALRIERLREMLAREEANLERDRQSLESWTRQRAEDFLRLGDGDLRLLLALLGDHALVARLGLLVGGLRLIVGGLGDRARGQQLLL
ncbi:MAG: hypothetical protein ACK4PI_13330, partial [Tepidisphaerales bacterium]